MRLLSKRNLLGLAAVGLGAAALSGCEALTLDPAAETTAKTAYQHFWKGEDAELEAMFEPSLRGPKLRGQLVQIRTLIPKGPPPAPKTVNWTTFAGTGGVTTTLVHEYDYPQNVVTVTTVLSPIAAKPGWVIKGFNVNLSLSDAPAASSAAPAAPAAPAAASPDAARPATKP